MRVLIDTNKDIGGEVLLNFYKWNYLRMIVYDAHQKCGNRLRWSF